MVNLPWTWVHLRGERVETEPARLHLERLQRRTLLLRHGPLVLMFTFSVGGHIRILDALAARGAACGARVLRAVPVTHLRAALEARDRAHFVGEVALETIHTLAVASARAVLPFGAVLRGNGRDVTVGLLV